MPTVIEPMSKKVWLLAVAGGLAVIAFWAFRIAEKPSAAQVPDASSVDVSDSQSRVELDAAGSPREEMSTIPAALRLGGDGLSLQTVFRDALAARGSDDDQIASFATFAQVMCNIDYPQDDARWKDPNRRWAIEYTKTACANWDPGEYRYTGSFKNALWYRDNVGVKEAVEAAMRDFRRTDNMLEVGIASMFLVEGEMFPGQASYDLPKEDLVKLAIMAGKVRTCAAVQACGSRSLITAEVCARVGCSPGTSFIGAVRRELSPREFEVMLKMRDSMAGH